MVLCFNLILALALGLALSRIARTGRKPALFEFTAGGGLLAVALFGTLLAFRVNFFGLVQLAAWAIFLYLPLFLIGAAAVVYPRSRRRALVCALLALPVVAVAVRSFLIEPTMLEVNRWEISSRKLSEPLTIAVVADLQTDRPGEFERRALSQVMTHRPDLVLLTGDYLQLPHHRYDDAARTLAAIVSETGLSAPLGIYAVGGNTDPPRRWPSVFDGTPVVALPRGGSLETGPLRLTGLDLGDSLSVATHVPESDRFHVVFGHAPDFSLGDVRADLLVAGHTHGGQVRLPWIGPLITFSRIPRAWAAGLTALDGGRHMVVSRGIGMERGQAPRLRFLCPPEIVLVDLVPGAAPHARRHGARVTR